MKQLSILMCIIVNSLAICITSVLAGNAAPKIKSKSVSLNTLKVTVSVGDIVVLNAIMKPPNSTDTISWSSDIAMLLL